MTIRRFLIKVVIFFMFSGLARAGGLRSNFGVLFLENLRVGRTYSILNLASEPLRVVNTTNNTVELKIEIGYPSPSDLRRSYEVIPSTSWIKLEKDEFTLEPGQMAVADFTISIPNDEKYIDKSYQFFVWSHVERLLGERKGGTHILPGVKGFICFTVAPIKPGVSDKEAEEIRANLGFNVTPNRITVTGIEVGKKYDIGKLIGKDFRLINPNDETFTYKMEPITVARSMMNLVPGYGDCPDPSFLIIDEPVFEVEGNSIKKKKIYIQFPKEDKYRNKKYEFIIYTYVLNQKIISGVYSDVFVITNP